MNKSEPKYGIAIFKDIMVPMRDGVRLMTDIYRPTFDGELVPRHIFPPFWGAHRTTRTARRCGGSRWLNSLPGADT